MSSWAAPAEQLHVAFTTRERKACSSLTPLSCAKAGAQEPSSRPPVGRAWLRGLTGLPTTAPVSPGRKRVSCTRLHLEPSHACGPPLEHRCQPAATAATKQGAQMPMVRRLKHLHNHRPQNTLINKGTHKIQGQEGCQNNVFLSKACTQLPQLSFREGPFRQKGPAQENRALIHKDPRLTKY